MLEKLLSENESKTLEFKENTRGMNSILKAIIAFANTSGGTIIVGVSDKDKRIVGVNDPLKEEERLANSIADTITPLLIPDIQIHSMRSKELLVIQVPHCVGPFYIKTAGLEKGTYVRIGSTNRLAGSEAILSLQMLAKNTAFDELPCMESTISDLDDELIQRSLSSSFNNLSQKQYESLGLLSRKHKPLKPTNAAILLFSTERLKWFPDSNISCVCFADETHEKIIDQKEISSPLIEAHLEMLSFIDRNTRLGAKIHKSNREDIPEYPPAAIREAIINTIVHADYSANGSRIHIAIFSNRIEITNPGGLPYGQTIELALSGVSLMRNRIIGRLFREIKLIERLGTGLKRIINIYEKNDALKPIFEEINNHFRVTLYNVNTLSVKLNNWETKLVDELTKQEQLGTTQIAKLWKVTTRTARTRLKKMTESGLINRVATSDKDPFAVFKIK